ncbi:lytic cellulose monooxygenase (C1-hydroxylating) [Microdochium nivale]|nr:lytic cellulose monooxygenase (C1-hydroxylating) [Microdochium nivale]
MEHPGPILVYMSRAPGDNVKGYRGDGNWFKVKEEGICNNSADLKSTAWCSWAKNYATATIPKNVPSGEYLMRFEHIGVHRSHVNQPEHYVSCVQIKVQGGGSGTPGPMVKFPGAYKASDPYANFSVYNGMKAFPMPGPAVYGGGGSSRGKRADDTGSAPAPTDSASAPTDVAPAPTDAAPPLLLRPTATTVVPVLLSTVAAEEPIGRAPRAAPRAPARSSIPISPSAFDNTRSLHMICT